jgi:hypothetical protein
MKRLGTVILVLVGVALILVGLLFLMGAAGRGSRYAVAAVGLCGGALLVGLGVRFFKQAESASPEQVRADILDLARRRNGELGEADLAALLGRRSQMTAATVVQRMETEGLCRRQLKGTAPFWVFPDLQPRLVVVRCEFCNAEFSVAETATECPNCGGTLKSQVERRSLSDGDYRMDE